MDFQRTIIGLALFLATAMCAATSFAQKGELQETQTKPTGIAEITVVVPLHHASAEAVLTAINMLRYPVRVAMVDDTKVLLRGDPDAIRQIQGELIPEIDTPASGTEKVTQTFTLDRTPDAAFVNLLRAAAPSRSTRIAFDQGNRLVVVGGSPDDIAAIKQVIASSNEPRASLTVSLYFIRGHVGAAGVAEDRLPESLAGVGRVLRTGGISDLSLLSPVIVTVDQGRHFEHRAALQGASGDEIQDQLQFSVKGTAQLSEDDRTVQITIDAEVHGEYFPPGRETAAQTLFESETTIATRLGETVVLAASPASTANGSAIALAISVSRN